MGRAVRVRFGWSGDGCVSACMSVCLRHKIVSTNNGYYVALRSTPYGAPFGVRALTFRVANSRMTNPEGMSVIQAFDNRTVRVGRTRTSRLIDSIGWPFRYRKCNPVHARAQGLCSPIPE